MRNIKGDRESENCEFCIEGLSVSPSQELLGSDFLPFWTLSGASWQPIGPLLEPFWTLSGASWQPIGPLLERFASFSSHLGSLLDRLKGALGRQCDFGYQNHRFRTSF